MADFPLQHGQFTETLVAPGTIHDQAVMPAATRGGYNDLLDEFSPLFGGHHRDRPAKSYSEVSVVYACVREKANAHGGLPLMVSDSDGAPLESGPAVELTRSPSPNLTGRKFWRNTSAFLDLFGRAFWFVEQGPGGVPSAVQPINPLQIKPKTNRRTGELEAWLFRPVGAMRGQEVPLTPDEVHVIVDEDYEQPDKPWEGLSPRQAAGQAIAQFYKADLANEASLDHGVEPTGLLHTEGAINDHQLNHLREEIAEKHSGVRNRRRMMVTFGGLKWQQMGASFSEMEFPELKRMSRTEICAVFSVPPPVVGFFEDSNYAHADAAEQAFWVRTILPRAAWLAEEWTVGVLSRFAGDRSLRAAEARVGRLETDQAASQGYHVARKAARRMGRSLFAWFDTSEVSAVQRAKFEQSEQARAWIDKGVPLNQVISAFRLPFDPQPWGETWWKPLGLTDVQQDQLAGPEEEDPSGAGESGMLEPSQSGRQRAAPVDQQLDIPENVRARLWHQWRETWRGIERGTRGRVRRHFRDLRGRVLNNLERVLPSVEGRAHVEKRDLVGQILFDLVAANETLAEGAGPLLREAFRLGGEQVMQEVADAKGQDEPDAFNIDDPNVQQMMRRRTIRITESNRTLRRNLADEIADGIDNTETVDQIADRIREQFNVANSRASTIARTEVGSAVEEARGRAREQAGVPMKSWLSSRKETGRPTHSRTETVTMREPVPQSENFVIAGTSVTCPHPRATGLPNHDINCGCTALSRFEGDTARSLIDRYTRTGFLTYERMQQRDRQRSGQTTKGGRR